MQPTYTFSSELWLYNGDGAWHFITLPVDIAKEIKTIAPMRRGFGSLRVKVTVGSTSWNTSIFPDSKSGSFFLPIKKDVRTKNKIAADDKIEVTLTLTDM